MVAHPRVGENCKVGLGIALELVTDKEARYLLPAMASAEPDTVGDETAHAKRVARLCSRERYGWQFCGAGAWRHLRALSVLPLYELCHDWLNDMLCSSERRKSTTLLKIARIMSRSSRSCVSYGMCNGAYRVHPTTARALPSRGILACVRQAQHPAHVDRLEMMESDPQKTWCRLSSCVDLALLPIFRF